MLENLALFLLLSYIYPASFLSLSRDCEYFSLSKNQKFCNDDYML